MIKVVLMAGGSGTRLWPLSRAGHPKQFLSINSKDTMLQSTMKRLKDLDIASSVTICNEEHRFFVAEQLREIDMLGPILLEPVGRNTAPAIALAALTSDDDPLLLVLAADHVIQDNIAFTNAVNESIPLAEAGKLVTFGVVPNEPHTGYGYIKKGNNIDSGYIVDEFVEKPSSDLADKYLASGKYLWNSGMFLFKASSYLNELKKFRPDIMKICESSVTNIKHDLDFIRINEKEFYECPSDSIDYAVMEKTSHAVVVPIDADWSDIGSWSSLWSINKKDKDNNSIQGDVITHKTTNSLIKTDGQLIASVGVKDLVIISTKDAILVSHRDNVQDTKNIVQKLKEKQRSEWQLGREVYRPWGKYDSVDNGDCYQVKRLTVNPGAKLSVQMHHHRSEHWVVVKGQARVHYGDEVLDLNVNESTYHGKEVMHALENVGDIPLELIEVQVGDYLGEDDIIRFKDNYGRVPD